MGERPVQKVDNHIIQKHKPKCWVPVFFCHKWQLDSVSIPIIHISAGLAHLNRHKHMIFASCWLLVLCISFSCPCFFGQILHVFPKVSGLGQATRLGKAETRMSRSRLKMRKGRGKKTTNHPCLDTDFDDWGFQVLLPR